MEGNSLTKEQLQAGIKSCRENPMPPKIRLRLPFWMVLKIILLKPLGRYRDIRLKWR
ncbi:MAG: hypothetical protein UX38_C0016G0006 [Microgenomates group bacterium GW2011_GWC1_46_16]|nr:MAG: hypothetical protein UX38_C0016G0006 [Microgenomates group bacterium GW2011_GWC1_46_16]